jgi:hypothetical protein
MPYKNVEERRLKQKLKKREQRLEGRQTIYALSPRPWTLTINGVVVPLSMTDAMPFAYRYN